MVVYNRYFIFEHFSCVKPYCGAAVSLAKSGSNLKPNNNAKLGLYWSVYTRQKWGRVYVSHILKGASDVLFERISTFWVLSQLWLSSSWRTFLAIFRYKISLFKQNPSPIKRISKYRYKDTIRQLRNTVLYLQSKSVTTVFYEVIDSFPVKVVKPEVKGKKRKLYFYVSG